MNMLLPGMASGIFLNDLKIERGPGLTRWAQYNHRALENWKVKAEGSEMEIAGKSDTVVSQRRWADSGSWKGQGTDSSQELPKGMKLYRHLDFSTVRPILDI